jgi:Secretion system C-terminal sorting domain
MKQLLKNYWFTSILIFSCALPCKAQLNIIPDGSFEDTVLNWSYLPSNTCLKNWEWFLGVQNPYSLGAAVLMSTLHSNPSYQLPGSFFTILPHNGFNAQELATHIDLDKVDTSFGWNYSNMRAPIRTKLKRMLKAGKQYCATIWVSAQARTTYYNTNGMGMYFDNGQLDTVITKLHDSSGIYGRYSTAQVMPNIIVTSDSTWTKIQGSFTANGTESYLTIGNWLTDVTVTKVLNGPVAGQLPGQFFSDYLIDDASVIPIDITTWLHDTTCVLGDSVWVGLDWRDYADGKWYNATMQYIKTGQGFWYKPTQAVTKFIQEIEVCGLLKYDTLTVYAYPLSVSSPPFKRWVLEVYPNPSNDVINIDVSNALVGQKIFVQDVTGKEVLQAIAKEKNVISLQGYASGIYIVKVGNQTRKVYKN